MINIYNKYTLKANVTKTIMKVAGGGLGRRREGDVGDDATKQFLLNPPKWRLGCSQRKSLLSQAEKGGITTCSTKTGPLTVQHLRLLRYIYYFLLTNFIHKLNTRGVWGILSDGVLLVTKPCRECGLSHHHHSIQCCIKPPTCDEEEDPQEYTRFYQTTVTSVM